MLPVSVMSHLSRGSFPCQAHICYRCFYTHSCKLTITYHHFAFLHFCFRQTFCDFRMKPLIISDEIEEEFWQPGCFTVVKQSVGDTVLPVHGRDAHVKNHISQTQGHDDQVSLDGSIPYHITVKAPAFLNGNAVFCITKTPR